MSAHSRRTTAVGDERREHAAASVHTRRDDWLAAEQRRQQHRRTSLCNNDDDDHDDDERRRRRRRDAQTVIRDDPLLRERESKQRMSLKPHNTMFFHFLPSKRCRVRLCRCLWQATFDCAREKCARRRRTRFGLNQQRDQVEFKVVAQTLDVVRRQLRCDDDDAKTRPRRAPAPRCQAARAAARAAAR